VPVPEVVLTPPAEVVAKPRKPRSRKPKAVAE
jgi:hypothetical protein